MSPLEQELRWERIWNIAALDATMLLRKEMNCPIELERVQHLLRSNLDKHYLNNAYGVAAGRLNFLIMSAVRSAIDEEELRLYLWGDRMFVLGAARTAEFFWLSVVQDREATGRANWIEETFARIRADMGDRRRELRAGIQMFSSRISDFDKSVLRRIDMTVDSLTTSFNLTGEYNIFARSWRAVTAQFSVDQLSEMYLVGKKFATKVNVPETLVAFPGTWEFGLMRNPK